MTAGSFTIEPLEDGEFNLKPKDVPEVIPEDQREIQQGIYETWGILKLLKEQGVIRKDEKFFTEFRERLLEVAQAGLAADNVKTRLAAEALEKIRKEFLVRKGFAVKLKYLQRLLLWGLAGGMLGVILLVLTASGVASLAGYGWVVIGAMAGAWMSVAATRHTVSLEELPSFLEARVEPVIRLVFVALLAGAVALMIELKVLTIMVSAVDFAEFRSSIGVALLLGFATGISEKALSMSVIDRAKKIITPA